MKTMLSTVLVAVGLTLGASAYADEPAGATPAAAHAEHKEGKREHHKGEHKHHHKGHHKHAHRRHERRAR